MIKFEDIKEANRFVKKLQQHIFNAEAELLHSTDAKLDGTNRFLTHQKLMYSSEIQEICKRYLKTIKDEMKNAYKITI